MWFLKIVLVVLVTGIDGDKATQRETYRIEMPNRERCEAAIAETDRAEVQELRSEATWPKVRVMTSRLSCETPGRLDDQDFFTDRSLRS